MSGGHSDKKVAYFARFQALLRDSSRILLVEADNVGSKLMQDIRLSFRGHATLVMGKNTMMRKAIREILPERPALENLLPIVKGNVGLIFTNGELSTITAILKEHKVEAAARTGATAQCDVTIPAGNTGLEPTQTSFLQALNIASKITKGLIEILNPVQICFEGVRVGPSEATLLAKLKIKPFKYGLEPRTVYLDSGETFPASVLDISNEAIGESFAAGIANVAGLSLATGFLTAASFPHVMINAFKNLLHVSIATEYTFKQSEQIKEIIANPGAFAAAAPAAGGGGGGAAAAAAPEPEEEESEEDMLDLFD
jgi:large subunit ribosomal protein LP0